MFLPFKKLGHGDSGTPLIRFDKVTKRMEIIGVSGRYTRAKNDLLCKNDLLDKFTLTYQKENHNWIVLTTAFDYCQTPELVERKDELCSVCHHGNYLDDIGRIYHGIIVRFFKDNSLTFYL